jgi:hypothetical protein
MADPNKIPLDVRISVCTSCGKYGTVLEACRTHRHEMSMVHCEIAASQNDPVAIRRVAELQQHGRRLLREDQRLLPRMSKEHDPGRGPLMARTERAKAGRIPQCGMTPGRQSAS